MHAISALARKLLSGALALCLLLNLTGCQTVHEYSLTYKLWTNGELNHYYEPAAQPRLELYHDPRQEDVLVTYDEAHESHSTVQRRAYFANRNRARLGERLKPSFIHPDKAHDLSVIPQVPTAAVSTGTNLEAVVAANGQQFTLQGGDFQGQVYQLPVYPDRGATPVRALFTPFAVAGDVVMVGLVSSVVAAYAYARGAVFR